ncbi:MAG: hypothetical protein LBR55_05715 [Bacteroidales bacterium]|jgi:hypothetical protein|nr:hypothetical protein [Bacteroidales bacterium]
MRIIPKEVSINSENKLRIENHTKSDVSYGTEFSLEYFNETQWTEILLNNMWEDIGINLKAGEMKETPINLYSNDAKKGKYRIMKTIGNNRVYAEFEVK